MRNLCQECLFFSALPSKTSCPYSFIGSRKDSMDLVHAYKVNVRFLITLIATESSFFVKIFLISDR